MPLDIDKYRPHLDGFDITEDQKTAMIEALWSIAEAVTDLAYGIHSTQLIQTANVNDSTSNISVIEFFQLAANDPVLEELADDIRRLAAHNDNIPLANQKEKESGT